MNKKEKIALKKETKKMFHNMMDTRDEMYKILDNFKSEHGFIPEEYKSDIMLMNAYKEYKRYGGWRKIPGVKLVINKAIQIYIKNKIKNPEPEKPMTIKEREAYLKRKTKEIYANVEIAKQDLKKIKDKAIEK